MTKIFNVCRVVKQVTTSYPVGYNDDITHKFIYVNYYRTLEEAEDAITNTLPKFTNYTIFTEYYMTDFDD